jgi:hypothetical protein
VAHVWQWWIDLHCQRRTGMDDCPLTYTDIDAWARLMDTQPRPDEIALLIRVDRTMLAKWRKEREAKANGETNIVDPKNPAAVRALTSNLGKRKKGKAT